eukprot:gnl/MRDRNA2_/MRDRNA2_151287_c0_seq1.p1 gnl/MRDRNA2_/MRDRNA2_151287_c0~~gnl/MRDRNA2_/MRDRNA2_151287_c0_seq1.p1  ORF type:complete len:911 (-),score=191.01 gnl/MRDRNA2_/MRDRNA2_151287_c0_seq1:16-2748(-)
MRALWVVPISVVPVLARMTLLENIPTEKDAQYVLEPLLDSGLQHLPPHDFETVVSRKWWDLAEIILTRAESQGIDFSSSVPKAVKAVKSRATKKRKVKSTKEKTVEKDTSSFPKSEGSAVKIKVDKPVQTQRESKKNNKFRFVHDGYEYRTIQENIRVDAYLKDQKSAKCHKDWEPVPEGYELAPDTSELRKVLTGHTWSTHVVILSSMKGYSTFSGGGFSSGQPFGDAQDKARRRVKNGVIEYMCPWECYQILVRRPVDDAGDTEDRREEERTTKDHSFDEPHPESMKASNERADAEWKSFAKMAEKSVKSTTDEQKRAAEDWIWEMYSEIKSTEAAKKKADSSEEEDEEQDEEDSNERVDRRRRSKSASVKTKNDKKDEASPARRLSSTGSSVATLKKDVPQIIQVVYDGSSPGVMKNIQLVQYRESTLPMKPTVALHAWPSTEADAILQSFPAKYKIFGARGRIVARLPTGLVLPHVEDDVMRLIYEMEYIAFVRDPDPAKTISLDQKYFHPIRQAQADATSDPWWKQEHVLNHVARALHEKSFCIIDNFLPEETIEDLRRGTHASIPEMTRGATGAAALVQDNDEMLERTLNEGRRGDMIKFCNNGDMPGCPELEAAVDDLVEGLKENDLIAERLQFVDFANFPMFSIYPGGASRYVRHIDNDASDGRRLTVILYLNKGWQPEHGGQLRLFDPKLTSQTVKMDVDPVFNRLLIFWADEEVPHEVMAAHKDRAAVSIWFLCSRESLASQAGFERLFNSEKARVMTSNKVSESASQRLREKAIHNAAETSAQQEFLKNVPYGNEKVMNAYFQMNGGQLSSMFGWNRAREQGMHSETDRKIQDAISQTLHGDRSPEEAFAQSSASPRQKPALATAGARHSEAKCSSSQCKSSPKDLSAADLWDSLPPVT